MLPCSVLGNISDATLVSILRIAKPVFYLLIISSFIIFLPILRIRINLEDFPFLFEGLRCNETRTNKSLSILVHVNLAVIFEVKSCTDSILADFAN